MEIKQDFTIDAPRERVWAQFQDVHAVASAVPGAEITESLGDNRYKGKISVKLGPMLAAFRGEIEIAEDPSSWSGVVTGKGTDAKSGSRAQVRMTYVLEESTADRTDVSVVSNVVLSGALAQFGRSSIINDISARITAEFVKNFQAQLAEPEPGTEAETKVTHETPDTGDTATQQGASREKHKSADPMDAGGLVFKVLWARIAGFFRRLFGRA